MKKPVNFDTKIRSTGADTLLVRNRQFSIIPTQPASAIAAGMHGLSDSSIWVQGQFPGWECPSCICIAFLWDSHSPTVCDIRLNFIKSGKAFKSFYKISMQIDSIHLQTAHSIKEYIKKLIDTHWTIITEENPS